MNIENVKERTINSVNPIVAQSSGSKSGKKSRRWDNPIRDKLEDVFCIYKSKFDRPRIIYAEATSISPKVVEANKFPMNGKSFTEYYLDKKKIMTIRQTQKIKVFALDIDKGSIYRSDYKRIIDCLEDIGFCRCIRVISSSSGGLHLWFPLSIAINSRFLSISITNWLTENGFIVKDGVLEVFPTKTETTWKNKRIEHLARCFRLPCQKGSYVIDEDENVIHNSIETFWLKDFDWCAEGQDTEAIELFKDNYQLVNAGAVWSEDDTLVIEDDTTPSKDKFKAPTNTKKKAGRPSRVSKEQQELFKVLEELDVPRNKYIATLKKEIKKGWTDKSQSNHLLACISIVASYENRELDELELAKIILWEAKQMKGYEEFASEATKFDLTRASRDSWARRWAKCVIKYRTNKLKK